MNARLLTAALLAATAVGSVAAPAAAADTTIVTVAVDTGDGLEYFSGTRPDALRAAATADGHIVAIGVPRTVTIAARWPSADTFSDEQWGIPAGGFSTLPARANGAGMIVAVIDTGVLGAHQDLIGSVTDGGDYVSTTSQTLTDPNGHGTHVAGIIAAHLGNNVGIAGAAPGATIRAYRALNAAGIGTTDDIARAITQAVDDGAAVINLSLSGPWDPVVDAAVTDAVQRGSLIVAAAGNNAEHPHPNAPGWPAANPKAVAVAATVKTGLRAPYSTIGPQVDLAAPGTMIKSTASTSPTKYRYMTGTSMATPFVSAAAAAIWSAYPQATAAQIRAALETTATDLGVSKWDTSYGHGEIDAGAALAALDRMYSVEPPPAGAPVIPASTVYTPVEPTRVFDTRPDGGGYAAVNHVPVTAGTVIEVQVAGDHGPVPTGVSAAVSLNVTVTNAGTAGFVTVYPCGTLREVSSVNFATGATVANAVLAKLSPTGTLCFYSIATVDIVVDVNGWFPPAAGYQPIEPARVFDTRPGGGGYRDVARTRIGGGGDVLEVAVTGGDVIPTVGVAAVSMNVAVTNPDAAGFVTVFPCGELRLVSSLNYAAGATVANAVIAPVSASGTVCFYSLVPTDIIVDVNGWFAAGGSSFTPVDPQRLFDTRFGDQALRAVQSIPVGGEYVLTVNATDIRGLIPSTGVAAVSLNLTATATTGNGYVTVYPCGTRREVSSLNHAAGATVGNAVIAPVAADGTICLYSLVPAHLIADINGWFAAPS